MIGADDVALVNQSQVAEYRSLLLKLPKNHGKDPKDFDRSLNELLEQAKTLPPDKVGRQGSTLNRHLTQLKSVIEYIETSGKSVGDYKGVHKLRAKVVTRTRDARAIFTPENVRGIFTREPWTGCESEKNRLQPSSTIIHDALYWVPLLAKARRCRRRLKCTRTSAPAAGRPSPRASPALARPPPAHSDPYHPLAVGGGGGLVRSPGRPDRGDRGARPLGCG